jgi:hypothetical protein
MTIGTNIEADPNPEPQAHDIMDPAQPNPAAEDDDPLIPTEKNAKGEDVAPVSSVIHFRKQAKEMKRENERLASEHAALKQQVEQWAPVLQRLQQDPTILQRMNQPAPKQEQPHDDIEARELAEDLGLITADGALDVARARRHLDRIDRRSGRLVDQRVAPVANATAAQIAQTHRANAKLARMKDGNPIASEESIDQVFSMLPPELTANQQVAALLPIMAAGLDKMLGRTPKAQPVYQGYGDPIFTEPPGRRGASLLTDDDKRLVKTLGLDEKKYGEQLQQLAQNGRRGVALE